MVYVCKYSTSAPDTGSIMGILSKMEMWFIV